MVLPLSVTAWQAISAFLALSFRMSKCATRPVSITCRINACCHCASWHGLFLVRFAVNAQRTTQIAFRSKDPGEHTRFVRGCAYCVGVVQALHTDEQWRRASVHAGSFSRYFTASVPLLNLQELYRKAVQHNYSPPD